MGESGCFVCVLKAVSSKPLSSRSAALNKTLNLPQGLAGSAFIKMNVALDPLNKGNVKMTIYDGL